MSTHDPATPRAYAVILAGGVGSRFWPASTPRRPKQLLPLGSERPLIVDTVERARRLVGPERVRILTGEHLVRPIRSAVPELAPEAFFVEPTARSTAPALVWAAHMLEAEDPGAMMVSLHSDHVIEPYVAFADTVTAAATAARERGSLVCLGIEPSRPETGYGYIELDPEAGDSDAGVSAVRRFHEKPDRETAERYCATGRHLWNSGIFVWQAADLLEQARRWATEIQAALPRLASGDVEGYFDTVEPVSVDVAILERSDRVEVARASFAWDDVGTWSALSRTREADPDGNVVIGEATVVDSRGSIVWGESGPVRLFGVDDLVVVRSGDETLVMHRDRASELKSLLSRLDRDGVA